MLVMILGTWGSKVLTEPQEPQVFVDPEMLDPHLGHEE